MIRYPFAPLAAAMGLSEGAACKQLNLSGSTEQEYRRNGVSEHVGDRLAVKAGFVPYEIWPEMLDVQIDDVKARATARASARRMRQARTKKGREAHRLAKQRWRKSTPEYTRRKDREHSATYYERHREEILARARERYHAKKRAA